MLNMVLGGSFRTYIWDPFLIITQILAMQCFYYFTLGSILSFLFLMSQSKPDMSHIFNPENLNLSTLENTLVVVACSLNSVAVAVLLCLIVQRAKLCLDFTCTMEGLAEIAQR